jgi:hypothetical protein
VFVRNSAAAGAAVQLCVPPWLGFVPDDVAAEPAAAIACLSRRLVERFAGIGGRPQHAGVSDQCEAELLAGPVAEVRLPPRFSRLLGRQMAAGEPVTAQRRNPAQRAGRG